eukprot:CAMPEP_0176277514 /NCGR_PEP_ID=MMETSP0121_2-20121125/48316_1 /TAXON_ID=160619 /ORGANISM="Kryptoperidinium foliaceum, Strain CCMP 1326" /LENGTH=47 /DNA_ID= /DNA_START= /DNA_END= /DNA_ORIENTATION=
MSSSSEGSSRPLLTGSAAAAASAPLVGLGLNLWVHCSCNHLTMSSSS